MLNGAKVYNFIIEKNKILILKVTILFIAIIILAFFRIQNISAPAKKLPTAIDGKLNLSAWNFQKDGAISLNGEWEFYWNKLLNPKDFNHYKDNYPMDNFKYNYPMHIENVPSAWRQYTLKGKKLSDEGYATYRLFVNLSCIPDNLAINTKAFISSCKIWIDNKEVYQAGIIGDNSVNDKGCFKPQLIPINPKSKQFYITIQISNYGYAYGGFVTDLELGNIVAINNKNNKQSFIDMFLFGSILIMGFYHFTLFLLRRKDYSTLYFGIICILIAIRTLLMGQMLLYSFFPAASLGIFLKLSMLTIYLGLTFFIMFIHEIFPLDTPKWFVRFSQAVGIFFSVITITFPEIYSNPFHFIYEVIGMFILIVLHIVLIKALISKRESSFIVLSAVLSLIIIAVNDILNDSGIISTGFYIPFGLLLFIFVQSFMLSRKFAKAFLYKEKLLKSELRMLQAQIKPHFLFNTLNTIIAVCRESSEKAEELLLNLSNYLRCGFSFKNDDEFVDFETELLHVKSYLYIEKERFEGKLNAIFDIDNNINCRVPAYILQPIVENSVRHGILPCTDGGTVKLTASIKNNILTVIIEDDGIGMTEEKLNSLLSGTDKNAGIGVSNVRKRIERIYGKPIKIESSKGKGTVVTFELTLTRGI